MKRLGVWVVGLLALVASGCRGWELDCCARGLAGGV